MFCPNCGKKLIEDARFCDNCGREISQREIDALHELKERQAQAAEPQTKEEFFTPPPEVKTEEKQEQERSCPYCKSKVKSTDVYCPVCKSYLAKGGAPTKVPKKDNIPALVGFILSLISFFMPETLPVLGILTGIASLVLGIIGLAQVGAGKGKGKGFAIAAIVFGVLTVVGCLEVIAELSMFPESSGDMIRKLFF